MFFARKSELKAILDFLSSGDHAMLVYGRRRVGKTTLLQESVKNYQGKVISYICTKESYDTNLQDLAAEYELVFNDSNRSFSSFPEFFRFLKGLNTAVLVILDEYSNLKEAYGGEKTDSMMQKIVDGLRGSNVKLALCGSEVMIMKELLDKDNPLFDRFDLTLHVEPFDYFNSALFFPDSSIRWKIDSYAVFGGLPAALERVDADCPFEENIKRLLLEREGRVRTLVERTLLLEYRKLGSVYSLFTEIGNGKRTYSDLKEKLDPKNTGNLSKLLDKLIANESIERIHPINKENDRKTTFYTISDNLLRFYFTYVHPNRSRIERFGVDYVYANFIAPSLNTYLSYRFEEIVRSFFYRAVKAGLVDGVQDVGTYWYDDKANKRNGEFDCVLAFKDGYDVFEIKYLSSTMDKTLADEEAAKIRMIKSFDIRRIGFVSLEGFSFKTDEYILVDGKDLFASELAF